MLWSNCFLPQRLRRDRFNQNFRRFRSKTQWIVSVQPEKFRKNWSTFWGGPLFPVGPVWILVEWIAFLGFSFLRSFSENHATCYVISMVYTLIDHGSRPISARGFAQLLYKNQSILRFDVILQHDWPIEQWLLHIRVFFGGKTREEAMFWSFHPPSIDW